MKILITNDDGIQAPGIICLAKAARKHGEVYVVAPDNQRSGASHSINLHSPIVVREVEFPVEGVKAFETSGSPADCVRVGMLNLVPGGPDVVLSGINDGYNSGTDTQYSGTIGAAMEAVFQGKPAIAFSEGFKKHRSVTERYLEEILAEVIHTPYKDGEIVNVNFPDCEVEEVKGILRDRFVSHTSVFTDHYNATPLEDGSVAYMVEGDYEEQAEEGSDLRALCDGYISIGVVRNLYV